MSNPKFMVEVGVKLDEFQKGMNTISQRVQKLGSEITQVGSQLTKAITLPIAGMAAGSVKAFDTQIKAEARLRSALEANGRQVGVLFKDYKEFASGLQRITTIGDETTLGMLQVAESMGLSGEQAKRAVKNAIAMESAFGTNAQSAIRYTSALEQGDSVMLGRYIPALKQIEDESERTAYAQDILAKAFGSATAEAQVGLGPIKQLSNNFGDLMEQIGELVSNAITPMVSKLNELVLRFQALDQPTKALYTGIALITAAIGPALLALGGLIRLLNVARIKMLGATLAIVGMVGGFIYVQKNLEAFEILFQNTWARLVNFAITGSQGVIDALKFISQGLTAFGVSGYALDAVFSGLSEKLNNLRAETIDSRTEFQTFGEFVNSLKMQFADFFGVLDQATDETIPELTQEIKNVKTVLGEVQELGKTFTNGFASGLADIVMQGGRVDDMLKDIGKQLLKSGLTKLFSALLTGGIGTGTGFFGGGGGLLGSIFPQIFGAGASPISMAAATPQLTGANVTVGGQFVLKGTDLVGSIIRTNKSILR